MENPVPRADIAQFLALDIRVGTILTAEPFAKARKPAYQLLIDFGPLGTKKSSAQSYRPVYPRNFVGTPSGGRGEFSARQIADFVSEVLVLGSVNEQGHVTLLQPERRPPTERRLPKGANEESVAEMPENERLSYFRFLKRN